MKKYIYSREFRITSQFKKSRCDAACEIFQLKKKQKIITV